MDASVDALHAVGERRDVRRSDLLDVIANGLCVGCGACTAADPSVSLHLSPQKLFYEPSSPGGRAAAEVCPSVEVDYTKLSEALFPDSQAGPVGAVESIYLAQSTNQGRNDRASSGGLIKELLLGLLELPEVDGVISLAPSKGLEFSAQIFRQPGEIDALPGSIYHSVSFGDVFRLLEQEHGRFVLVGIPCQLEGVFNYVFKRRPDLREKIFTTVGLICGWTYSRHSLKAIAAYNRVPYDQISEVSYRGGGPVGPLRLTLKNRQTKDISRRNNFDYECAFDRSYNLPRCHLCVNHINFLAEFVVGDAWLKRVSGTKTGVSLLLARTKRAQELIQNLEAQERIRTSPGTEADVEESQSRNFTYGDRAYEYLDYLRRTGARPPLLFGPNHAHARPSQIPWQATFHASLQEKLSLQREGKYRLLWLRKLLVEQPWRLLQYGPLKYVRLLKRSRGTSSAGPEIASPFR